MATAQDFTFDQGTSIRVNFTVTQLMNDTLPWNAITNPYIPIDLSGSSIAMMARVTYDSPIISLNFSTANGKISITNAIGGLFSLILLPVDTEIRFSGESVELVYDLEITDIASHITRAFEGTLTISREVTR